MKVFSHNHKNDTMLFTANDGVICLLFTQDDGENELHMFDNVSQEMLFELLGEYFETGKYANMFDDLTIPAQDALWNALFRLDERHLEV